MTYFKAEWGEMIKSKASILVLASLIAGSLSACGAGDHGHDRGDDSHLETGVRSESQAKPEFVDHSKFGHMSAVYLCGDEELQTSHTDAETKLAYKGHKIDVSRKVSILDEAFAGESFQGKLNGQTLIFKGKGYDASLKIGDELISCQKLTCIPLGGPH